MPVPRGRCLLDTNILLYAALADDPRHSQARRVVDAAKGGRIEGCLSVQNLAEMYPNLTGPKRKPAQTPDSACDLIARIAQLRFLQVLPLTGEVIALAWDLCRRYDVRQQDYFDAQIVATMLFFEVEIIVTENVADFELFQEIRVFSPFS